MSTLHRIIEQNTITKEYEYIEYSDEDINYRVVLGNKSFKDLVDCKIWKSGFANNSYVFDRNVLLMNYRKQENQRIINEIMYLREVIKTQQSLITHMNHIVDNQSQNTH